MGAEVVEESDAGRGGLVVGELVAPWVRCLTTLPGPDKRIVKSRKMSNMYGSVRGTMEAEQSPTINNRNRGSSILFLSILSISVILGAVGFLLVQVQ